ncbi:MAG TPA: hypothetical protein VMT22_05810 [Terriglobales bacterium]|nr:hypothetical protein [Terriglobales bacterium]
MTTAKKIQTMGVISIGGKPASRDHQKYSLSFYREKLLKRAVDLDTKNRLYWGGLISQRKMEESELAYATANKETEDIRQSIAKEDIAISLVTEGVEEETGQLRSLPLGAYTETPTLIQYNGAVNWSPAGTRRDCNVLQIPVRARAPRQRDGSITDS